MSMAVKNIPIFKASMKDVPLAISGIAGGLANYDVYFFVREYDGADPVITKVSTDATEIEITDEAGGLGAIHLVPDDTSLLVVKQYIYSVWIYHKSVVTDRKPVITGFFWIQSVGPSLVSEMRLILDEGGELGVKQIGDDIITPTTVSTLYVSRGRILEVQGVWALTDETHALTNYYTGGGFTSSSGKVWLGTDLPTAISDIRVSYTWVSGIASEVITRHLETAKIWVWGFTGVGFEYQQGSTTEHRQAEEMAIALTIILCILTINGANVAQMGYNFRIQELEIQTKLWGEGMIAQALFEQYKFQLDRWIMILGIRLHFKIAGGKTQYNLNTQLLNAGQKLAADSTEGAER